MAHKEVMARLFNPHYEGADSDHDDVHRPIRPYPSFIFLAASGLWLASAVAYQAALQVEAYSFVIFPMIIVIAALLYLVRLKQKRDILIVGVLSVLVGLSLGGVIGGVFGVTQLSHQDLIRDLPGGDTFEFELIEDERSNEFGSSGLAKTKLDNGATIKVRLLMHNEDLSLSFGTIIRAKTSLELPGDRSLQYYWEKGIIATARVYTFEEVERSDLFGLLLDFREAAIAIIGTHQDQGSSLLRAILFGDREGLDEGGFYQDIRTTGLAHLVAVSGAHLVIVGSSVSLILRLFRVPRSVAVIIQVVFLLAYLVFTGMPISALRAAGMSMISLFSFYSHRRSSSLNALALCVIIMIALSPEAALSISFTLSVLSTFGIIVLSSLTRFWIKELWSAVPRFVLEGLSLTIAASILITPLSAALFSQISLITPFMNVLAAPLFTLLCVYGLITAILGVVFPGIAVFLIEPLHLLSQGFTEFVSYAAAIPYAAIPASIDFTLALMASISMLVVLWLWWPTPSKLAFIGVFSIFFLGACSILIVAPYLHDDEVIMLDVGQGDAFLVRSKGTTVLIDTGNRDADLREGLGRHGVYRLDAVIISHADDDHCGSLASLRGVVVVDHVMIAEDALSCGCSSCESLIDQADSLVGSEQIRGLNSGDVVSVGRFDLEVIWPDQFSDEGGNADSLSLLLSTDVKQANNAARDSESDVAWKVLFCGDAEAEELAAMIAKGRVGDIDILKVGHHGSRQAVSEDVLRTLAPEAGLVSVGADNRYGHPAPEILDSLDKAGCEVFRSDEAGDVVCKLKPERISITTLG